MGQSIQFLGGLVGEDIYLIPERVQRLIGRLKLIAGTPPKERRIWLYGFPPGYGATGTAALLNVPRSSSNSGTKDQGYTVGFAEDGRIDSPRQEVLMRYPITPVLRPRSAAWLPNTRPPPSTPKRWKNGSYLRTSRIEKQWKSSLALVLKHTVMNLAGGVPVGQCWIGVQPPLGIPGDPMRLMFERDLTPIPICCLLSMVAAWLSS